MLEASKTRYPLFSQRNYRFDQAIHILKAAIDEVIDPLALLVVALLLREVQEDADSRRAFDRVEGALSGFQEIEESTMQIRDCLTACGYYYVANKLHFTIRADVDHIARDRVKFALSRQWMGNTQLMTLMALVSDEVEAGNTAKEFLDNEIQSWLNNDYLHGVLHYSLLPGGVKDEEIYNYLKGVNWEEQDIMYLGLGLIAFNKQHSGRVSREQQNFIANSIMSRLSDYIIEHPLSSQSNAISMTNLDFAFAAYALRLTGYDSIIGFQRHQEDILANILDMQYRLSQGGVVLSRGWWLFYQLSFIAVLAWVTWVLGKMVGLDSVQQVLFEIVAIALAIALGAIIFRRGSPAVEAIRTILGDSHSREEPNEQK